MRRWNHWKETRIGIWLSFLQEKRELHNKWVYRLKEEDGGKKQYKARLVVKGFAQKKGIEFDEIFSCC